MILGKYITYIFGDLQFNDSGFLKAVEKMVSDIFNYYLVDKEISADNGKTYKIKKCKCIYSFVESNDILFGQCLFL